MRTKPESSRKTKIKTSYRNESIPQAIQNKSPRIREIEILRDIAIQDATQIAKMQDMVDNKMSDSEARSIKYMLQKERNRLKSTADNLNAELPANMRLK